MNSISKLTLETGEYVIANVNVVDPVARKVFPGCVGVKDGKIQFVDEGLAPPRTPGPIFDGEGLHLSPGFVDIHVHLREPGFEYKETVRTGSMAAAAGGFTSIACMPNTHPAIDERSVVEFIRKQARIAGLTKVYPVAAATVGRMGEQLTEYHELVGAGAVAVSDDGAPVASAGMVRRVLEYAHHCGIPLIEHCEDLSATGSGVMHEGFYSTKLGLSGVPAYSEQICLARDLLVLRTVPTRYHAAHISAKGSVDLIREAKRDGLPVTAETAPHYICFEDRDLETFNTNFKINPPLRSAQDREAIIEGLKDGTLDSIASDHAPHAPQEKEVEFEEAPSGTIGLETTFAVVVTHLVNPGHLGLAEALAAITYRPADALGIPGGRLAPGQAADIVLFDLEEEWTVGEEDFHSLSKNSAFIGCTLKGRVKHTILDGVRVTSMLERV